MATLEDGGTCVVEDGVLYVRYAGRDGVAVDLRGAQSVSYTRGARIDDFGALVVRVDDTDVVAKLTPEDGLKLIAQVRAALPKAPDAEEQRFDTDGGAAADDN
jgi:hypothetical protein